MVRSLSTWLWLVDFQSTDRALDATDDDTGDVAEALRGHFDRVEAIRDDAGAAATLRTACEREGWVVPPTALAHTVTAPWGRHSFDCVVAHDALLRRCRSEGDVRDEFIDHHRLLRPGGWLQVSGPSSSPLRRSGRHPFSRERLTRLARAAGFREIRNYFVEPGADQPIFLIPDSRDAAVAYESSHAIRAETSLKRRTAARVSLPAFLYPAYFLLARA